MLQTTVSSVFQKRRSELARRHPDTAFVIPANVEAIRNFSTTYPFRQDSSFFYLTGMEEPEAVLVLVSDSTGKATSTIFVRNRDVDREIWEGERYGTDRAKQVFGFQEAYVIDELDARLSGLLKDARFLHTPLSHPRKMTDVLMRAWDKLRGSRPRVTDLQSALMDAYVSVGELRLFKDDSEIEMMERSAQISAETHTDVMKWVRPGMDESEVEVALEFGFRRNGAKRLAYGSIVAGGSNATCLHYHHNNCLLKDGDLLLIDAAGEYEMYASDITRTFPVGKKFTQPQAELYDLVLKAQKAGIEFAKPGVRFADLHQHCAEILVEGLIALGLMKGNVKDLIATGGHKRFYPHNTGHWIGLDVHDSGLYMEGTLSRKLEAGMVITIEPGIYVQPSDQAAPEKYRGIGIRIEDDVLITQKGCHVLTAGVPKERAEIEALRS